MTRRHPDWGDDPRPAVLDPWWWLFLAGLVVVSFVAIHLVLRARGL